MTIESIEKELQLYSIVGKQSGIFCKRKTNFFRGEFCDENRHFYKSKKTSVLFKICITFSAFQLYVLSARSRFERVIYRIFTIEYTAQVNEFFS